MRLFGRPSTLAPAGLSHYRRDGRRLHLRVQPDGSGILGIDASRILHLNRTACDMAWLLLEGVGGREAARRIAATYRIRASAAEADMAEVARVIEAFLSGSDPCPVSWLGLERIEPFTTVPAAPYRADLALTYRCNADCLHCYNGERTSGELPAADWKRIMGILWDQGVPHVAFTGGESTLRPDLPGLVAHAESLGMIAGLLTNGIALAEGPLLGELVGAGLDYVQVTLESSDPAVHDAMTRREGSHAATVQAIRNCVGAGLCTITNTTLTRANAHTAVDTLRLAAGLGLGAVAMNGMIHSGRGPSSNAALEMDELKDLLSTVSDAASEFGVRLIWYSPTRYCELDPVSAGLGPKRCTAGHYNICIEPDGSVLPCQSYYKSAGNILTDSWDTIYKGELLDWIRSRAWLPSGCLACADLALCGGGCPLEVEGRSAACPDMLSNA
jgi:radical SAM protein with 4Fe4S-binding SPASM domain